jgi:hypothetical protein
MSTSMSTQILFNLFMLFELNLSRKMKGREVQLNYKKSEMDAKRTVWNEPQIKESSKKSNEVNYESVYTNPSNFWSKIWEKAGYNSRWLEPGTKICVVSIDI